MNQVAIGQGAFARQAMVFDSPEAMGEHVARLIVLLIHGAGKRAAVKRLDACHGFDPLWPASFIFECPNSIILLDQEFVS
jgi:hypothetical protein